jgi:hypothetical protein
VDLHPLVPAISDVPLWSLKVTPLGIEKPLSSIVDSDSVIGRENSDRLATIYDHGQPPRLGADVVAPIRGLDEETIRCR